MLVSLLLVLIIPAQKAVGMPAAKLGELSAFRERPMTPPKKVDNVPRYGPRRIPMIGATIAAAVIPCGDSPIIGEILIKPRMAYNAVKTVVKATSFVLSLGWLVI